VVTNSIQLLQGLEGSDQNESSLSTPGSAAAEPEWRRRGSNTSLAPVEPHPLQYVHGTSSGRNSAAGSTTGQATDPNSSPGYAAAANAANSPLSPLPRVPTPRRRGNSGHGRRASDHRNQRGGSYSHRATSAPRSRLSSRDGPPADDAAPSSLASAGQQQQQQPRGVVGPPPQPVHPEFHLFPVAAAATHRPTALAPAPPGRDGGRHGHSRDSSGGDGTAPTPQSFYAGSFYANASQNGGGGGSAGAGAGAGAGAQHHQRRRRGNLPKDATKILRQWYDENQDAPYPGEDIKNMLCQQTGLQLSQVSSHLEVATSQRVARRPVGATLPLCRHSVVPGANVLPIAGQQLVHKRPPPSAPNPHRRRIRSRERALDWSQPEPRTELASDPDSDGLMVPP
jgi:hypothetical protein